MPKCLRLGSSRVIFVKKKDGTLRVCIYFRHLNKVTINNKYSFPRIGDFFDQLKGERIFSNMDLGSSYHQVRIKEEDMKKKTFKKKHAHYEFTIVSFGLSNVPTSFIFPMSGVFREHMDKLLIVFLEDISIYSKSEEENEKYLGRVLLILREHKLYAKISKCIFYQKNIHYLGHIFVRI